MCVGVEFPFQTIRLVGKIVHTSRLFAKIVYDGFMFMFA